MRIVKQAEERRNEILDAADVLFGEKGFDGTSTNDILEKVGIARGTLYYHFKSKEDIMDALIERYNTSLIKAAQSIANDQSIPVLERMMSVVMALNVSGDGAGEMLEHIHKPQNALMHQKIQKVVISGVPAILSGIVEEGVKQGIFDTPYPYECMEMLLIYLNTIFDHDMVEMSDETKLSRIQAVAYNAERLLGAESGSLMSVMAMLNHGGS